MAGALQPRPEYSAPGPGQGAERIPVTLRDLVKQHRVIGSGVPAVHRLPPGHQRVPHASK
jgi:hypothetical protein